ncbi:hypothetical protein DFH06DRAFT_1310814 [Mycena polygramma]|nr:hypothetical protein DFH06DRAFT_1310814 [Mycena polygramma]
MCTCPRSLFQPQDGQAQYSGHSIIFVPAAFGLLPCWVTVPPGRPSRRCQAPGFSTLTDPHIKMVAFNKFFTSVFLAIVYASSSTLALTVPTNSKHATHRVRLIANDTFGAGIDHPSRKRGLSLKDPSTTFISAHLGVDSQYHSGFANDVASHAYAHQLINGIPVSNAVSSVAFNADDLVAVGSSFIKPTKVAPTTASVSFDDAKATAESALDGTYLSEIPSTAAGTWYNAFVDAHSNKLPSYVAQATYHALPITKETLLDGFEDIEDPADVKASPFGWHSDGTTNTTDTSGNNVLTYKTSTTLLFS